MRRKLTRHNQSNQKHKITAHVAKLQSYIKGMKIVYTEAN